MRVLAERLMVGPDRALAAVIKSSWQRRKIISRVPSMEPVFKLASASNLDTLICLMSEFYVDQGLHFDEKVADSALKLLFSNEFFGKIYIIYISDKIIGYLVVTFGFSLEYRGRDAFIDELYIQEQYRRQGIGKKALQLAEKICREQGIQAVHLEVERENTQARALYGKVGFTNRDRYLLTKWLDPGES